MRLARSEEQVELGEVVRRFLSDASGEDSVRRVMESDTGIDAAVWKELAVGLGVVGLAVPERLGGAGAGHAELAVVFEELGRSLACVPMLSTVGLALNALLLSEEDEEASTLIAEIVGGERIATLIWTTDPVATPQPSPPARGWRDGDNWRIEGSADAVLDGAAVDLLLVLADTEDGPSLLAVDRTDPGVRTEAGTSLDLTRRVATVTMDGASARLVGAHGGAAGPVQGALLRAQAMMAAEQVGGAQRCLEMSVDYAKQRHQFARPVGSFQAVKHLCADMLTALEGARSAALAAAWAVDGDPADLPVLVPVAQATCSDAFFHIARDTIQVHGGIGYTWEHPAHLYFKRAKSSQLWFGDAAHHRAALADHIGL